MAEQTFGDFVAECRMYDFSEEKFNLMKECSEFALMEQYIKNQTYIRDNTSFIENVNLKDGYLSESVNYDTLLELTEAANKKGQSIWKKIINGIVKIWKTFVRFIKKILNIFDKLNRDAIRANSVLNKLTIDDKIFNKLKEIVKVAYSKSEPYKSFPNQPFLKKLKFNYSGNEGKEIGELKNDLAAALSTSYAYARLLKTGENDSFTPIPVEDIKSASRQYFKKKAKNLKNAMDILLNAMKNGVSKGMEIDVNSNRLEKIANTLQDLIQKIDAEFGVPEESKNVNAKSGPAELGGEQKKIGDGKQKWAGKTIIEGEGWTKDTMKESYDEFYDDSYFDEAVEDYDGGNIQLASSFLNVLTRCIGDTITIYTSYNKYRKCVIDGILKLNVEESGKDLSTTKKPSPPPEEEAVKVGGGPTPRVPGGNARTFNNDELENEKRRREQEKVRV